MIHKENLSFALKTDNILKILAHACIWILPWFFLRYYFILPLIRDNDFVTTHASCIVYLQTLVTFYFVGYYVFPNYLYKKKYAVLVATAIFLLIIAHLINYFEIKYLLLHTTRKNAERPSYIQALWADYMQPNGLFGVLKNIDVTHFTFAWSFFVASVLLFLKISKDILISKTRSLLLERSKLKLENEKLSLEKDNLYLASKQFELERDNLNLELNFLKSQINPHFLFNILNSIYYRTVDFSEEASDLVLKLSDLMRYGLYIAGEDKVLLRSEVDFIKTYVDLEKYRYTSEHVQISFVIQGKIENQKIAPLMLISFIENAFKHGVGRQGEVSYVVILVDIRGEYLSLTVENSTHKSLAGNETNLINRRSSGIGLKNTLKRLQLLYDGKYELDILETEGNHCITLLVTLEI